MKVPAALTVAGSDSGGGAGIQADLKTFQELGVYGMSVITAVTAQNTFGVQAIYPLPEEAVEQQLASIGADTLPDAMKIGMLHNERNIRVVADFIESSGIRLVVADPVMMAKGGSALLQHEAIHSFICRLLPVTTVVTPNIPEAEALTGVSIQSMEDRKLACRRIRDLGAPYVVIKGGHEEGSGKVTDLLYDGSDFIEFSSERIATRHTHGTGCTFASAIAAELAKGRSVADAVFTAKRFIDRAIQSPLGIGGGHGPLNHFAWRGDH